MFFPLFPFLFIHICFEISCANEIVQYFRTPLSGPPPAKIYLPGNFTTPTYYIVRYDQDGRVSGNKTKPIATSRLQQRARDSHRVRGCSTPHAHPVNKLWCVGNRKRMRWKSYAQYTFIICLVQRTYRYILLLLSSEGWRGPRKHRSAMWLGINEKIIDGGCVICHIIIYVCYKDDKGII